jgi:integrase
VAEAKKKRGVRDGVRRRGSVWLINYVDANGERREMATHAKTHKEALEIRARLVDRRRQEKLGIWEGDASMTVADLFERYRKANQHKRDWGTTEGWFKNHLLPEFGRKRLRNISPSDVEIFLAGKAKTLSPRSREHLRAKGRQLFRFGIERERAFTGQNPFAVAPAVSVPEREVNTIPPELIQDVIDAVPEKWRSFFALALYTGLRSSELRALRPAAIDRHHRWITVSRSGNSTTTKTGKVRPAPIPQAALPYLQAALEKSKGRVWVFCDDFGEQLSRDIKPERILREALERLGLISEWRAWCYRGRGCKTRERFSERPRSWTCPKCGAAGRVDPYSELVFHDLRKTFESMVYEMTSDPVAAARLTGHRLDVAERHYIRRNKARLEAMADTIDFKKLASTNHPHESENAAENGANAAERND